MADEPLTTVEADLESQMDGGEKIIVKQKYEPVYKLVGKSKIPVAKKYGPLWKSRKEQAEKKMKNAREAWDEAIRYFDNDQSIHREGGDGLRSGNRGRAKTLNATQTETENVVFANVTTMVTALYARNPKGEFTATDKANAPLATLVEHVVNALAGKKAAPGINLKPKARRAVTTALLTNRAWMEVNWTFKDDSSEQALADLDKLAKQLAEAKDIKDIEKIEGEIEALEKTINVLQPAGPFVRLRHPKDVIVDPTSQEIDASDAKWLMIREWLPTSFIRARYSKQNKDGEAASIYQPTHILKLGAVESEEGHSEGNFSLFSEDVKASYGYEDDEAFDKAKMTECFYVWDKITRRVSLYNNKDWTWPIWVWDDPLQLDTFFNAEPLFFHDGPMGPLTKGEVSYYLDQQDAINEITSEERVARNWAKRNVFFNKNVGLTVEDVTAVLSGPDETARGVNVPEGMKMSDVITSIVPPSANFPQLFDKEGKYKAIDRISGLNSVLREGQFKTNANKDAVKAGTSLASMRVEDKGDQLEDWLGGIFWKLAQLCLQFMDKETVISLVGQEEGQAWQVMTAEEIRRSFSVQVLGGSTKKPTSQAKKEEAIELGQVLGQFANVAPGPVTMIMLKVMQQAFDEITMTDADWEELKASIEQQNQAQQTQPQGAAQGQGQTGQTPQSGDEDPAVAQVKELIASLPPEKQQQLQELVKNGTKPAEALKQVTQ